VKAIRLVEIGPLQTQETSIRALGSIGHPHGFLLMPTQSTERSTRWTSLLETCAP
jgi:hypothetical protein